MITEASNKTASISESVVTLFDRRSSILCINLDFVAVNSLKRLIGTEFLNDIIKLFSKESFS